MLYLAVTRAYMSHWPSKISNGASSMDAQSEMLNNGLRFEDDISKKNNLLLSLGIALFGVAVAILVVVLTIYFSQEVEKERYNKFVLVESAELQNLKNKEAVWLSGSKSLVDGNSAMPIDDAIAKLVFLESKRLKTTLG